MPYLYLINVICDVISLITRCNRKRAVTKSTYNCFTGHFTGTGDAAVSLLLAWIHILREQEQLDTNDVNDTNYIQSCILII